MENKAKTTLELQEEMANLLNDFRASVDKIEDEEIKKEAHDKIVEVGVGCSELFNRIEDLENEIEL